MKTRVQAVPTGYHTITPYLMARDAAQLLDFIEQAFGAVVVRRMARPDGAIAHAEAQIGDSRIMLAQGSEKWPARPCALYLYVEDVDRVFRQAVAAGARPVMEPTDMYYGDRHGGVTDMQGNDWWIATHIEEISEAELLRRDAEYWKSASAAPSA
ncbi:MAG: VOC family protein [Longimicrobiales bacterium]